MLDYKSNSKKYKTNTGYIGPLSMKSNPTILFLNQMGPDRLIFSELVIKQLLVLFGSIVSLKSQNRCPPV